MQNITFVNGNNSLEFRDDTMTRTLWKRCQRWTDGQTFFLRVAWSQLKKSGFQGEERNTPQMFQIVSCVTSALSWKSIQPFLLSWCYQAWCHALFRDPETVKSGTKQCSQLFCCLMSNISWQNNKNLITHFSIMLLASIELENAPGLGLNATTEQRLHLRHRAL